MPVISAHAAHITTARLGGTIRIHDANTGALVGQCELVRGFAQYTGVKGSAHEGVTAVVYGGLEGLILALREGLRNQRDDRLICDVCGERGHDEHDCTASGPTLSREAERALKQSHGTVGCRVRSIISGAMDELRAAGLVGANGGLTKAGVAKHDELLPPIR